ncbi:hypothetical protein KCU95_g8316, partial [Aureobasidium melanogenum]
MHNADRATGDATSGPHEPTDQEMRDINSRMLEDNDASSDCEEKVKGVKTVENKERSSNADTKSQDDSILNNESQP